jgi:hypothetical protein
LGEWVNWVERSVGGIGEIDWGGEEIDGDGLVEY